ncbi:sulfite exporter TauE/SafE family protein [Bowmanella yangjiangensis]|uniref:Probable membrane transporter protein n=1 Tax=Bowmanella yangjiangensis TaxID=2811230 RepID=A0ABS3CW19_9ALTE|nr:sulfite exporter TauE/SafE family protein [Bowmanella yangjiangensis]MBN7820785.1 sulfite exporter TauE/SafE family protein [Bowmanella yangjiangensis]
MLMDLDPFGLGLISLVVVLTGISKSGFAGALGIFSVPLLLLVLSPQQALGLMLPLLLLADMFSLKSYWRQWDGVRLRLLLPGVAIGLLLGSLLLGHLPTLWLQGLIGALSCLFALRYLLGRHLHCAWLASRPAGIVLASASGLSSTLLHAGGPPLMMHLLSLTLPPATLVATSAVVYAGMNVAKLFPFVYYGVLDWHLAGLALVFFPLTWLGNRLGLWLRTRLNNRVFMGILHGLLLLMGVKLIWQVI